MQKANLQDKDSGQAKRLINGSDLTVLPHAASANVHSVWAGSRIGVSALSTVAMPQLGWEAGGYGRRWLLSMQRSLTDYSNYGCVCRD